MWDFGGVDLKIGRESRVASESQKLNGFNAEGAEVAEKTCSPRRKRKVRKGRRAPPRLPIRGESVCVSTVPSPRDSADFFYFSQCFHGNAGDVLAVERESRRDAGATVKGTDIGRA
jgi:hypothetical protein